MNWFNFKLGLQTGDGGCRAGLGVALWPLVLFKDQQTACPIGFPLIYIHHQKEEVKIPDQSNTPYFPYSTSFLFLIKAFAVLFGKDFI
jgi:hypothetical protein